MPLITRPVVVYKTRLTCEKCDRDLTIQAVLTSNPVQYKYECKKCGDVNVFISYIKYPLIEYKEI